MDWWKIWIEVRRIKQAIEPGEKPEVLCSRMLSAKVEGKMSKSVLKPAVVICEVKTVAVTERQEEKMEVADLKIMR